MTQNLVRQNLLNSQQVMFMSNGAFGYSPLGFGGLGYGVVNYGGFGFGAPGFGSSVIIGNPGFGGFGVW